MARCRIRVRRRRKSSSLRRSTPSSRSCGRPPRGRGHGGHASLLALAQGHRHKLQSAIENAERGVALEPANRAAVLLLAHLLVLTGRTADAAARLDPLQDYARTDASSAFLMVRLRLMQRDTAGALQWAGVVQGLDPDGALLIGLGQAFGAARLAEPAATFFGAAAQARFAPEAGIGL